MGLPLTYSPTKGTFVRLCTLVALLGAKRVSDSPSAAPRQLLDCSVLAPKRSTNWFPKQREYIATYLSLQGGS